MTTRATAAKLEPEAAQAAPARAAPRDGTLALASAIGNSAFTAGVQSGAIAPALARQVLADPAVTRAPWASAGAEIDQALANVVLLRRSSPSIAREEDTGDPEPEPQDSGLPDEELTGGAGSDPRPQVDTAPIDMIAWLDFFAGAPLNFTRSGLEVLRAVPTGGALAGAAADVAAGFQDVWTLRDAEAPITTTFVVIRGLLNTFNNLLGHIAFLQEVASGATLASIAGSWLTPVLDMLGTTLKGLKLLIDYVIAVLDIGVFAVAHGEGWSGTDEEHVDAWRSLSDGYLANLFGDMVTLIVDTLDVGTATEAKGEVVKQVYLSTKGVVLLVGDYGPLALNWIQGAFNVWGGAFFEAIGMGHPDPEPDAALSRSEASEQAPPGPSKRTVAAAIAAQLEDVRTAYGMGDELLTTAGTALDECLGEARAAATQMNDGRDPMLELRDAGVQIVDALTERADTLEGVIAQATDAEATAGAARAQCAAASAAVEALALPEADFPGAETLLAPLASGLEELKAMAREPLESMASSIDEVAEFMQRAGEVAATQVAECRMKAEEIEAQLADADTAAELVDVFIGQIAEGIGLGEGFDLGTVRAWWEDVGAQIDAAHAWALQAAGAGEAPEPPPIVVTPVPSADGG